MNRAGILLDGQTVTISLDDAPPDVNRVWGVIGIRLVDEWTRQPPRTKVAAATAYAGLTVHVSDDGAIGLAGVPIDVFPGLHGNQYKVDLSIRAEGFVSRALIVEVNPQILFPTQFTPVVNPGLYLHRLPVVVRGRTVVSAAGATTPAAGAAVRITGIWRTAPPANAVVPADPPNLACLEPPVYADRKAGVGALRRCDLTPVLGDDKLLLDAVGPEETVIRLSNRQNINAGDVVRLDATVEDRMENIAIQSIAGGSTPNQEAWITLEHPVARLHRRNSNVRRVTVSPPGPANLLADDVILGDTTVFTGGLGGLAGASFACLEGGPAPEYHAIRLYSTVADGDGYFRLPPVSRTAWLAMEASDGVHLPVQMTVSPDYEEFENVVDFVIG